MAASDSIFNYSKEGQDILRGEEQVRFQEKHVRQQEDAFDLQKSYTLWVKEVEHKNQIQRDNDRKSDRKFLWIVTLVSAVIGAISTIFFERFFK